MFARVLIDMWINGFFPDEISFIDENDDLITQQVLYDWKPILCQQCAQFGHSTEHCKKVDSQAPIPTVNDSHVLSLPVENMLD